MRDLETLHFPISTSGAPVGWEVILINEIVSDVQTGFASGQHNSDGIGIPHLRPMNISADGKIELSDLRYVDPTSNPLRLQRGDVLFNNTNSPAWVGKTALVDNDQELAFSNHMTRLRMQVGIDPRFTARQLHFVCRAGYFEHQCKKHVNQASINRDFLVDHTPFILPPLNEQRRIADKLDAVLARVDACRKRLDRVPTVLKRFRQSVLDAATRGRLTEEWRNASSEIAPSKEVVFEEDSIQIPESWTEHQLTDLIDPSRPLCYGVVQPGKIDTGGVPLIRVQDMESGSILVHELRTVIPEIDVEYRRSRVLAGDLLVSVVGTIGRTAIVPTGINANIARAIARIACKEGVLPHWVNYWLNCDTIQWWLTRSAREVARKTLNLSDLGATRIALPPEDEQIEIVRRVETLFAFADRLEARYATARNHVERLTPALLAKAFRGELVPQDPNDEPASELLKRIQAARAAQPTKPKRGKNAGRSKSKQKAETNMLNRKEIQPNHLATILNQQGALTSEALWSASQLDIDDYYDQLKDEEEAGLLKERWDEASSEVRLLEAA